MTKSSILVMSTLIGCGLVTLFYVDPAYSALYAPCPFHALTGLYCPGCGSLRAVHQLMHGHVATALDLNPLMVLSLPFLGYTLVLRVVGRSVNRIAPVRAFWIWMLLAVIIAFFILRNIPAYPFSLLAP